MIPPDCLEDRPPWINVAARAWMGNLEVGRNAALLGGTRREEEGITGNGEFKHRPTIACLQEQNMSPNDRYASSRGGGEGFSHGFGNCCWAGIQQLDGLLGLATNTPNS